MSEVQPVFTGVGVALVTVFRDDGEVDYDATGRLAAGLVEAGVRGVIVAGTTGEFDALDDDERVQLFEAVRAAVPPDAGVPIIAGTGGSSARQARALTLAARERGVDAVLARSPRAVADPTQYYLQVADAADGLPVLAYHFPAVAPPGIPLDILIKLPVSGCKDSSGSAERMLATLDAWDRPLYVGSPALLLAAGQLGCAGAILALANSEPELCAAAFAGDAAAQRKLTPAMVRSQADFPRGVKHLVAERFGVSAAARMG